MRAGFMPHVRAAYPDLSAHARGWLRRRVGTAQGVPGALALLASLAAGAAWGWRDLAAERSRLNYWEAYQVAFVEGARAAGTMADLDARAAGPWAIVSEGNGTTVLVKGRERRTVRGNVTLRGDVLVDLGLHGMDGVQVPLVRVRTPPGTCMDLLLMLGRGPQAGRILYRPVRDGDSRWRPAVGGGDRWSALSAPLPDPSEACGDRVVGMDLSVPGRMP